LKAIIADIDGTKSDAPYSVNADKLQRAIGRLTQMMDAKRLNDVGITIAYFFRAKAKARLNAFKNEQNQRYDVDLARASLSDYDKVIQRGVDAQGWGANPASAGYTAGGVAKGQLKSLPLAYAYWERCAQKGHAGCMNIVADARLTGKDGQKADAKQSVEWNTKVYRTGTKYNCAGTYSAWSIALITFFTGVKSDEGDTMTWFRRATELVDTLPPDYCHRARLEVDEYMVRLSRDDSSAALLSRAGNHKSNDDVDRAELQLLSGALDFSAFDEAAAKIKSASDRCDVHFHALWLAEIKGNHKQAQAEHQALLKVGQEECATELVYAKKFGF
jgi:hypothetical protein